MSLVLDPVEVRVLGALLEKEITTPEYYPLTLNALVNACNQKSNRDPVVSFDEETVGDALLRLKEHRLAYSLTGAGMRVPKYGHRFGETLNLGRRELAVLCELMIRGPQTLGELRTRTERMHKFDDLDEVERCLTGLMEREAQPLVTKFERQAGYKEPRYAHLLSGDVELPQVPAASINSVRSDPASLNRIEALEAEVSLLRDKVRDMEQQWTDFRRQFE
jgi:hypothetical protein